MELNKIYNEDCLETMKLMPDNFVDLTVTSPPYDQNRTYTNNNGLDWSFDKFKPIAKELYRVTKKGGVIVWIVGDTTDKNGSETGTSFRQALYFKELGFNIHDTMIYAKQGFAFPYPNRYHQVFEYMFIFSKDRPKTVNFLMDRKNKNLGYKNTNMKREQDGSKTYRRGYKPREYGKRYNIWEYKVGGKDKYNHPAIYPDKLAYDSIYSWSNEGDLVYDPFMGSGTTAKCARILNRNYVGSEISKEYCDIINQKIYDTNIK